MLTDAQRQLFLDEGTLAVPGALGHDEMVAMRSRVWQALESNGARRDDPASWSDRACNHLQRCRVGDPRPGESAALAEALDDLFGAGKWEAPRDWGQALVTFPSPGPWRLPESVWHVDHPYWFPVDSKWGVNVFLFVSDVGPGGGGPLVIVSSPHLVRRFLADHDDTRDQKMKSLRRAFDQSHPWLRELTSASTDHTDRIRRFMCTDTDVHGVPARVRELTGAAGDAVICHPWTVHCAAQNTSGTPRIMRVARVYHYDYLEQLGVARTQGRNDSPAP